MVNYYNFNGIVSKDYFNATVAKANKYLPVYIWREYTGNDFIYFKNKIPINPWIKPNSVKNILRALAYGDSITKIVIQKEPYYFSRGLMLDKNHKILLAVVVEKVELEEKIFTECPQIILYASEFMLNPELATLNRRLQKEILSSCYLKGMEVRVLSSSIIEQNTFARLFEVKKTKTVVGLEQYLKEVLPTFLFNEGEDTFVEEAGSQSELLSIEEEALLYDSDSSVSLMHNQGIEVVSGEAHTSLSNDFVISTGTTVGYSIEVNPYTIHSDNSGLSFSSYGSYTINSPLTINGAGNSSISISPRAPEPDPSIVLIDDTE